MRYKYNLELNGCDLVDIETSLNLDFDLEKEENEAIWELIIKSLKENYGTKDETYCHCKDFWWHSYFKVKSKIEVDKRLIENGRNEKDL